MYKWKILEGVAPSLKIEYSLLARVKYVVECTHTQKKKEVQIRARRQGEKKKHYGQNSLCLQGRTG